MALKVTLKRVHLTLDANETGGRVGLGMEGDGPFMMTFTAEVMRWRTRAGSGEKNRVGRPRGVVLRRKVRGLSVSPKLSGPTLLQLHRKLHWKQNKTFQFIPGRNIISEVSWVSVPVSFEWAISRGIEDSDRRREKVDVASSPIYRGLEVTEGLGQPSLPLAWDSHSCCPSSSPHHPLNRDNVRASPRSGSMNSILKSIAKLPNFKLIPFLFINVSSMPVFYSFPVYNTVIWHSARC